MHVRAVSNHGSFLLYRKDIVALTCESCSCKEKTLREEAHSRVMKMLPTQPRSARESASGLFVLYMCVAGRRNDFLYLEYFCMIRIELK